jgi:hypothetical protein
MPALIYHNMTKERGCQLRATSVSRRVQCPGLPGSATQAVSRSRLKGEEGRERVVGE